MTQLLRGSIASTTGSCPICGSDVPLRHGTSGRRVSDAYGCPECGPVVYQTAENGAGFRVEPPLRQYLGGMAAVGLAG